jgi:hypothetical protein
MMAWAARRAAAGVIDRASPSFILKDRPLPVLPVTTNVLWPLLLIRRARAGTSES